MLYYKIKRIVKNNNSSNIKNNNNNYYFLYFILLILDFLNIVHFESYNLNQYIHIYKYNSNNTVVL